MNRFSAAIGKAHDKMTDVGAKAMLTATNAAGRLMNTRVGKAMFAVSMVMSACAVTVHAVTQQRSCACDIHLFR